MLLFIVSFDLKESEQDELPAHLPERYSMHDSEQRIRVGSVTLPSWISFPKDKRQWFWLSFRILAFVLLLIVFFRHPAFYTKVTSKGVTYYKKKLMLFLPCFSLLLIVLPCFRLRLPLWLRVILAAAECIAIPLMALVRTEMVQGYNFWNIKDRFIHYNYYLAAAIFLIFFVVTNRIRLSAAFTYLFIVGFGILNHYIYKFRGEPINAADLYVIGTALNVANSYTFDINKNVFFALYEGTALLSVLNWLPPEECRLKWKPRLVLDVAAIIFSVSVFRYIALSDVPLSHGLQVKHFRPMQSYKKDGEILCFVRGFYYMVIKEPDDYSPGHAASMMENSGHVSDAADADDGVQNPNIILILDESLTDYSEYDVLEPSEDPLKYIHSLAESKAPNVIAGNLHTDVFGGRTANSEYEVLTGNSIAFFPYNTVPYALFLRYPTPSIVWSLRDIGYSGNYVFHPYKANGYSRPRAYPNLGFEEFISIETISADLTDADYVRNRVSDWSDFETVIDLYEQTKQTSSDPFFIFNITMQNHGGFTKDFDNFEQSITISGALEEDAAARRYLNLIKYSDEAFRMLTDYFSKTDDPTVIVIFGDHQPNLHHNFYPTIFGKKVSELDDYEEFQRYDTPVIVWANYDINPDGMYDSIFEEISINYLSTGVMKAAGLPLTAYQKFELRMMEEIPVFTAHGYLDKYGMYYDTDDKTSPYYSLVNEYYTYEYNYQFDEKHRQEDFFRLQADQYTIDAAGQ